MHIKHQTNKVGVVPYRVMHEREFLVHLPKPKRAGEEQQMQWGLARGTVMAKTASGEYADISDRAGLEAIPLDQIEDHEWTAQKEAFEELGIEPPMLQASRMQDHGLILYASQNALPYPIHFYSFHIEQDVSLDALNQNAQDAQQVAWKSLDELHYMAHESRLSLPNQQFKPAYIAVLEEIVRQLPK